MKPILNNILNCLSNKPLEYIDPEDVVNTLENFFEEVSTSRQGFSEPTIRRIPSKSPEFPRPSTPCGIRAQRTDRLKQTPPVGRKRTVDPSYSLPATPKPSSVYARNVFHTPNGRNLLQTPRCTTTDEGFVLNTPMIASCLQSTFEPANYGPGPDILQMIDDDSGPIDAVDRQLRLYSDTDLTDDTVVEYLLDLSQNINKPSAVTSRLSIAPRYQTIPVVDENDQQHHKTGCRKARRAKPVSKEERESLRRLKKEKRKEKRKQFSTKWESKGTRRSKRTKKQTVRYTSS